MLCRVFIDGSRQDEKVNIVKFDRHESGRLYLKDEGIKLYIFPFKYYMASDDNDEFLGVEFEALTPDLGSFIIEQRYPCNEGNTTCTNSPSAFQEKFYEVKNCSNEVRDELYEYYSGRNKLFGGFS